LYGSAGLSICFSAAFEVADARVRTALRAEVRSSQVNLLRWQDVRARAIDEHLEADRRRVGERVAEIFRWVAIIILAVVDNTPIADPPVQRVAFNLLLTGWALANLAITYVLVTGYRPGRRLSTATLVMDLAAGAALLFLSNQAADVYLLAFFLALIASSVRLGTIASIASALVSAAIFFVHAVDPLARATIDPTGAVAALGQGYVFLVVALSTALMTRELERERRLAISRAAQADALREMSVNMASTLEIKDVFPVILQQAVRMSAADSGRLVLVFEDGLQLAATEPLSDDPNPKALEEADAEAIREVSRTGEAAFVDGRHGLVVPLASGDGVTAIVRLTGQIGFTNQDLFMINALAGSAAIPLANALHYQRSAQDAITDGLTGLLNHREFRRRLEVEFVRAEGRHRPVSLVLLDLDGFKSVNDSLGHQHGDEVLKAAAQIVRSTARAHDLVARYGGDELAVIALDAGSEGASSLAERLVEAVHGAEIKTGLHRHLTLSIGVATHPDDAVSVEELIMAADQAMYLAKREGKDRFATCARLVDRLERDHDTLIADLTNAGPQVMVGVAHAIDRRNSRMHGHSSRVAALAEAIAKRIGYLEPDLENLRAIAFLHDLGTLSLPADLAMHDGLSLGGGGDGAGRHVEHGEQVLQGGSFPAEVARAIRHHHERWDGLGYPDHLAAEKIPIGARIVALADVFEVMTAGRVDGKPVPPLVALEAIALEAGRAFDPHLVEALRSVVEDGHLSVRTPWLTIPISD
jgi:diguanylate cyclase (GGDEF)-like protein/putative nucleotidyltransferase with HDIG domain